MLTERSANFKQVQFQDSVRIIHSEFRGVDEILGLSSEDQSIYKQVYEYIKKLQVTLENYSAIQYEINTYQEFQKEYWTLIDQLHHITINLSKRDKIKVKQVVRGEIFKYFSKSTTVSRAYGKPFGYPGDYQLLQMLYDDEVVSESNIGKYYDRMFLNDPLSVAVVNRVETMGDYLTKYIVNSSKAELNILNIASGSGFEFEKLKKINTDKVVNIFCFDQEISSLLYVKQKVSLLPNNFKFTFIKEDIVTFFKNFESGRRFDLAYNIGLADYLPDRVLISLINNAVNQLSKGGKFVVAHKDYEKFPYQYPEWTCDWNFFHRTFTDYQSLIDNSLQSGVDISYFFESEDNVIYFGEYSLK